MHYTAVIGLLGLFFATRAHSAPVADGFVDLRKFDMAIRQGVLMGKVSKCVLRQPAAKALSRAASALKLQGFGVRVTACYVPSSLGRGKEGQAHATGAAVDVMLVDVASGALLPSPYLRSAPRDVQKKERARLDAALKTAMEKEGFVSELPNRKHFRLQWLTGLEPQNFPVDSVI